MARHWVNAVGLVGMVIAGVASVSYRAPTRVVANGDVSLASFETAAARHPGDPAALAPLVGAYLDRGMPGPAIAALARAPEALVASPSLGDSAVRAYFEAGRTADAQILAHELLARCGATPCDATLVARLTRRADVIDALAAEGLDGASVDAEAVDRVAKRTLRTVRVALNN